MTAFIKAVNEFYIDRATLLARELYGSDSRIAQSLTASPAISCGRCTRSFGLCDGCATMYSASSGRVSWVRRRGVTDEPLKPSGGASENIRAGSAMAILPLQEPPPMTNNRACQ
jgi:hypothetical protein